MAPRWQRRRKAGRRKEGVARTSSLWPGALQFIDFSSSSSAAWPPGAAHSDEKQSVGKKSKERERETFSMNVLLFFLPPRGDLKSLFFSPPPDLQGAPPLVSFDAHCREIQVKLAPYFY